MKKLILLTLALVCASLLPMYGQTRSAEFPGGQKALDKYIYSNLKTYNLKRKLGKRFPTASVVMDYSVNQEGRVVRLKKISSPHSGFTDEVARVFRRMPKWKPATRNGVPYLTKHRYTVKFDLRDSRSSSSSSTRSGSSFIKPGEKRDKYRIKPPRRPRTPGKRPITLPRKPKTPSHTSGTLISSSNTIYKEVDKEPEYPGGSEALLKEILANPKYKIAVLKKRQKDVSEMHMVLTKYGKLEQIRSYNSLLDYAKPATEILQNLKHKWTPAIVNGKYVNTYFKIFVPFYYDSKPSSWPTRLYLSQYGKVSSSNDEDDNIYTVVENRPEYPGGLAALHKEVAASIRYPQESKDNGMEGTVYVRFVVTKTGTLDKFSIVRGVDSRIDQEAIRVIKSLKHRWSPGKQRGKSVHVWYTIPVKFKLQ